MADADAVPKSVADEGEEAQATAAEHTPPMVLVSGMTHPGVEHRQNQDAYFLFQDEMRGHVVAGVLDGHGRQLGQVAALAARDSFKAAMSGLCADNFKTFRTNPVAVFQQMFDDAHDAIRVAFKSTLEEAGFMTKWENGVLLKASPPGTQWRSVSGGTTCTVMILLDGYKLYVANVGDSDCLLCAKPTCAAQSGSKAAPIALTVFNVPASAPSSAPTSDADRAHSSAISKPSAGGGSEDQTGGERTSKDQPKTINNDNPIASQTGPRVLRKSRAHETIPAIQLVECTSEHSAEAISEFRRMQKFRPSTTNPRVPELQFVYDAFGYMKHNRPPIFKECATNPGEFQKTNKGVYHKNVRAEFATLVSTPSHADYQDGLAFTRSLGDFYLHTYGVSATVDVQYIDLSPSIQTQNFVAICLASDGVWDNWKFPDLVAEMASPSYLNGLVFVNDAIASPTFKQDSTEQIVEPLPKSKSLSNEKLELARTTVRRNVSKLMRINHARATANFGSSMDNMTLALIYVLPPFNSTKAESEAQGNKK